MGKMTSRSVYCK